MTKKQRRDSVKATLQSPSPEVRDVLAQMQQDVNGLETLQMLQSRLLVETREQLQKLTASMVEHEPS